MALTGSAYAYVAGNPLNLTDPSGLYAGQGLVKSIGNGLQAAGCWISDHRDGIRQVLAVVAVAALLVVAWELAPYVGAYLASVGAVEAGPGGIGPVLLGQAGKAAVRASYDIGAKTTAVVDGRTRIFDGLNSTTVSEVKNVASQSYTQQLRDSVSYAQANGLRFDLYVRPATELTRPLLQAVRDGLVNLRFIP